MENPICKYCKYVQERKTINAERKKYIDETKKIHNEIQKKLEKEN